MYIYLHYQYLQLRYFIIFNIKATMFSQNQTKYSKSILSGKPCIDRKAETR